MIGQTISHFRILEKLGEGGMGIVYLAQDLELARKVAIKFLPSYLTKDQETLDRFKREAKAAAALNHPNIVTIYEVQILEEHAFIVMEYVEGKSLREMIIEDAPFLHDTVAEIVTQICQGLSAAHQAGIVHRDIKPDNIMWDNTGCIKILDFGLAKLKGVTKLTAEATRLGTVQYMSPEQVRGEEVDHRSDIWSLGIVLYEMLSGKEPFAGEYVEAVQYAVLNLDYPSIDSPLSSVVTKCFEKEVESRYQNIDELIADLAQPVSIKPISKQKVEHNMLKSSIRPAILILFAIIVAMVYFFTGGEVESNAPTPIAVVDFINETGEEELNGLSGMLTTALEQSRMVSVITRSHMFDILKQMGKSDVGVINEEVGKEIAIYANVKLLALASIKRFDQVYNIDLKLIDALEDKYLFTTSIRGEGKSEIPSLIDNLSEEIRYGLNETEEEIQKANRNVASITTPNLEAYQHFFKGQEYIDLKYFLAAQKQLEKAIELDSTFGLAYYRLAYLQDWQLRDSEAKNSIRMAYSFIENIPQKERYLLHALKTKNDTGIGSAYLDILKEVEKKYPNEKELLILLGDNYYQLEQYDEAIKYFRRVIEMDKYSSRALDHIIKSYSAINDTKRWLEYSEKYVEVVGNWESFIYYANIHMQIYGVDSTLTILQNRIKSYPRHRSSEDRNLMYLSSIDHSILYLYACKDNYEKATEILMQYDEEIIPSFVQMSGMYVGAFPSVKEYREKVLPIFKRVFSMINRKDKLTVMMHAAVLMWMGEYHEAIGFLQQVEPSISNKHLLAASYAYTGDYIQAEKIGLSAVKQDSADYTMLSTLGFVNGKLKRYKKAKDYFNKSLKLRNGEFTRTLLAWVEIEMGQTLSGIERAQAVLNDQKDEDKQYIVVQNLPIENCAEYILGLGYLKEGKYKSAIKYLESASRLLQGNKHIITLLDEAKNKI